MGVVDLKKSPDLDWQKKSKTGKRLDILSRSGELVIILGEWGPV